MLGVDDNATNRTLLEGHQWGMQIDCVADGAQALARCVPRTMMGGRMRS